MLCTRDVEKFLYQFGPDRRHTQDSPVLPSVWKAYITRGGGPVHLLLTPMKETRTAQLAASIREAMAKQDKVRPSHVATASANAVFAYEIAHNQSTVAVSATFEQMVTTVVPFSPWWRKCIWPHLATVEKYAGYSKQSQRRRRLLHDLAHPEMATCGLPLTVVWWLRLIGHIAIHL